MNEIISWAIYAVVMAAALCATWQVIRRDWEWIKKQWDES